jgi:hypothetical protein
MSFILNKQIFIYVGSMEKYGFTPEKEYPVLGTMEKPGIDKSGGKTIDCQLVCMNDERKIWGVYLNNARISRIEDLKA